MNAKHNTAPKCGIQNLIAIWLWLGWIVNYYLFGATASVLAYLQCTRALTTLMALMAILVVIPPKAGYPWLSHTLGAWIVRHAVEYFGLALKFEDESGVRDAGGPMIFAMEPHDVLPVSMCAFHFSLGWVPGHTCAGLMTSAVFMLPGMKSVFATLSARPVDRATFSRLLAAGRSCCFCPGGVQEVINLRNSSEVVLFLRSRLGFARLALKHRAPAVPCFTFGLSEVYSHRFLHGPVAERIARAIGFLPGVYWGLWNLPFGPPRSRPLTVVVGKPIPLPEGLPANGEDPPKEMVARYHAAFLVAMEEVFEKHKHEHGMGGVALRII